MHRLGSGCEHANRLVCSPHLTQDLSAPYGARLIQLAITGPPPLHPTCLYPETRDDLALPATLKGTPKTHIPKRQQHQGLRHI